MMEAQEFIIVPIGRDSTLSVRDSVSSTQNSSQQAE